MGCSLMRLPTVVIGVALEHARARPDCAPMIDNAHRQGTEPIVQVMTTAARTDRKACEALGVQQSWSTAVLLGDSPFTLATHRTNPQRRQQLSAEGEKGSLPEFPGQTNQEL